MQYYRYHKTIFLFLSILFLWQISIKAQPFAEIILNGIRLSLLEKYDEAVICFFKIDSLDADHPAGPFFRAAVLQSKMLDYESRQWRSEFYAEIDTAIKRSKALLKKFPQEPWIQFYFGASYAYLSYQQARDRKYLSAMKSAQTGIDKLQEIVRKDSSFCDAYVGIGSYKYWKSHATRNLHWLPFFSDERDEGIRLLENVTDCIIFSRWSVFSNLAWIYIQENNYEKAISFSKMGLEDFPNSRFFLWPLGEAQLKDGQYKNAKQTFIKILQSLENDPLNNHYNEILLLLKIVRCSVELEQDTEAVQLCERIMQIAPDAEVKKRAESKKKQALKMIEKIKQKHTQ